MPDKHSGGDGGSDCPDCSGDLEPAMVSVAVDGDDNPVGPGYVCESCGHRERV